MPIVVAAIQGAISCFLKVGSSSSFSLASQGVAHVYSGLSGSVAFGLMIHKVICSKYVLICSKYVHASPVYSHAKMQNQTPLKKVQFFRLTTNSHVGNKKGT